MYIELAESVQQEIVMHKANNTQIAASLREMAAVGIPVDLSVAEPDVEIRQVGAVQGSMVFDLPDGRAGCIIDLLIINQTSKPISFRNVELRPPWTSSEFEWLPDPKDGGRDPFNYNFPGKGAPELPREQVINHVLFDRGILKPRCPVEGWLLGVGNPKPEKLLLGGPVEVTLAIIGHDHSEYEERIILWVDTLWKRQQISSRKFSREGLYASDPSQNRGSPNFGNITQRPSRESATMKKINGGS
jgi:hypothetical protein